MSLEIIGFCGAAGSGKDESARVLCDELGYTKRSFADALRREVRDAINGKVDALPDFIQSAVSGCISAGCTDPWEKPTPPEMRVLLQLYGTDFRRKQSEQYWVNAEMLTLPAEGRFAYTDVRFPNEVRMIRSLGGTLFRVDRPGYGPSDHASEQHFQYFEVDRAIPNDGTVGELHMRVRLLMSPLGPEDYAGLVHARQARQAAEL